MVWLEPKPIIIVDNVDNKKQNETILTGKEFICVQMSCAANKRLY